MALFVVQNRGPVELKWLWLDFEAPLWIVLLVAFFSGGLATPLLAMGYRHFSKLRAEQQQALHEITISGKDASAMATPPPHKSRAQASPPENRSETR